MMALSLVSVKLPPLDSNVVLGPIGDTTHELTVTTVVIKMWKTQTVSETASSRDLICVARIRSCKRRELIY